jgi:hypothetical protein
MQETLRKSFLTLPLTGPLAVANGAATFIATHKARIAAVQLTLSDTGTGAGSTKAMVNVNGAAITADGNLAIAGAAAGKAVQSPVSLGVNNYPGGALINPGDTVTIDISAVPATAAPKGGSVILDLTQVDA